MQVKFNQIHLKYSFCLQIESNSQEGGDGCINDYLEINTQRYCGKQTGLILRVPFSIKSVFEMRFHSDSDASIQNKGFNIRVRELDQQATTARKALLFSTLLLNPY